MQYMSQRQRRIIGGALVEPIFVRSEHCSVVHKRSNANGNGKHEDKPFAVQNCSSQPLSNLVRNGKACTPEGALRVQILPSVFRSIHLTFCGDQKGNGVD